MANKKVSLMVLTALFTALTAVGAFIRIPTPTVAFTLQILFVFLAGIQTLKRNSTMSPSCMT